MAKIVIVTGGSGGLGSEVALQFALSGAKVVINYRSNKDDAEIVASKVRKQGGEAEVFQADVCNFSQVKAMGEFAIKKWGAIDVLVNCAGGGPNRFGGIDQLIIDTDEATWDKVINVNLKGTFICIKAIAPYLIKQSSGHIINVSAGSGVMGKSGRASYAAAKAGVLGLTKTAARELGEHNVKVNAVFPGRISHGRQSKAGKTRDPGIVLDRVSGSAVEFGKFIVHVSTMENISGQTLNLDSRILF